MKGASGQQFGNHFPPRPPDNQPRTKPIHWREAAAPATNNLELAMEQYLFDLSGRGDPALSAVVQPNVWLLSSEEIPPILFTAEEVARLLGIGKCRVYDLIRQRELRSVKVGPPAASLRGRCATTSSVSS